MKRQEANIQIVAKLTEYLILNPDIRFGQALRNLGIITEFPARDGESQGSVQWANHFYEEPQSMLKRMNEQEKKDKLT